MQKHYFVEFLTDGRPFASVTVTSFEQAHELLIERELYHLVGDEDVERALDAGEAMLAYPDEAAALADPEGLRAGARVRRGRELPPV
jgi:hypothetical protein